MKIKLTVENIIIPAELNNTVAAQDFAKRLPIILSGNRSEFDYCCHAACGLFNPTETQNGWKNGDISLADGWFAVFLGGEEQSKLYRGIMVIAHIDDEYIEQLKELPESVKFIVEAENEQE